MDKRLVLSGLLVALSLAIFLSPFASPWPDGLEKAAEDKGFIDLVRLEPVVSSPIPEYAWPGIKNKGLGTSIAGLVCTLMLFALGLGLGHLIKGKNKQ